MQLLHSLSSHICRTCSGAICYLYIGRLLHQQQQLQQAMHQSISHTMQHRNIISKLLTDV